MKRSQIIGAAIFLMALEGIIVYGIMVYYHPIPVLQLSVSIIVVLMLGVTAWIGYRLMMTPPRNRGREAGEKPSEGKKEQGRG